MNTSELLKSLPEAATSAPAFAAYVITAFLSFLAGRRNLEVTRAFGAIKHLPEKARPAAVAQILGEPVPPNLTAEEWLRYKRLKLLGAAGLVLVGLLIALVAISYFRAKDKVQIDQVDVQVAEAAEYHPQSPHLYASAWLRVANESPDKSKGAPKENHDLSFPELPTTVKVQRFTYTFDVTVRNSGRHDASVTRARIVFDAQQGRGPSNVQDLSGTYVLILDPKDTHVETPLGRFKAEAWYPTGSGRLVVETPLTQTVFAGKIDRIRIQVKLGNNFELRGPMESAEIELTWNGKKRVKSSTFKLPPRPKSR